MMYRLFFVPEKALPDKDVYHCVYRRAASHFQEGVITSRRVTPLQSFKYTKINTFTRLYNKHQPFSHRISSK